MRDADTDPAAHRVQMEVLRRMGPERRMALAFDLCDAVRAISEARRQSRARSAAARRNRIREYYGLVLPPPSRRRR